MRIVLMGPPGAGKGTQANRLVQKFQMAHLSSGDIFRAEKASGSLLGRKLAEYMNAGALVPDETVVQIMAKAIAASSAVGGLLLDGFPRTVSQAAALDEQLAKANKPLDAVVVMTADDELVVQRITGRRSCTTCGKIYHVTNMPPKIEELCDDCHVKLLFREDDKEATIRNRLAAYYRQTEPVIAYYRSRPGVKVVEIDGTLDVDDVTAVTIQALESLRPSA
jgi:adenylate kinase